ncbi:MAG: cation:proton antiporter [Thaumarchaeota archaeon]|nr:MAG: cation:proton antiporter [Nitrososphaerota archaeon]
MDSTTIFLLDLGIFSVFALIFSLAFARLRLPVVSAQIVAGMIAGPYVLGWVKDLVTINDLSAIGIVLLLFVIGLELDPVELRKLAGRVAGVAVLEMGVAFLLGFAAASVILGAGLLQSIIFAMVASISSTAIVGKMFLERGSRPLVNSPEPGALMALMILEDMVAVVFLIALSSFTSNSTLLSGNSVVQAVTTIGGGIALVVAGYLVATYVAPKIIDYLGAFEEEYEEIPFLFALGLGFVFAVLAAVFGYSPGTGAFIIGLSIRGKRSKFLKSRITTIKDLFIVLFFISMGSLINPSCFRKARRRVRLCQDFSSNGEQQEGLPVWVMARPERRILFRHRATRFDLGRNRQRLLLAHRVGCPCNCHRGACHSEVSRAEGCPRDVSYEGEDGPFRRPMIGGAARRLTDEHSLPHHENRKTLRVHQSYGPRAWPD